MMDNHSKNSHRKDNDEGGHIHNNREDGRKNSGGEGSCISDNREESRIGNDGGDGHMDDKAAIHILNSLLLEEVSYMDHYKQKLYQSRFEGTEEQLQPLLKYMEELWSQDREGFALHAHEWAAALAEAVEALARERMEKGKKREWQEWMDEKRAMMALYILPVFDKQRRDYADVLLNELFIQWNEAFPDYQVLKATYGEIMQGFKKRGFGCYITSAVCSAMNRSDDCYELSAFRKFRDDYLVNQPDGDALIREYYENAPKIVRAIDASEDAEQIYCQIWEHYLLPCLEEIEAGENEACKERYVGMVRELEKKFLGREAAGCFLEY